MKRMGTMFFLLAAALCTLHCAGPQVKLFSDASDPLKEFTLQGTEKGKVLIMSLHGIISTRPDDGMLRTKPSMIQEVVSQLRLAEKDKEIRCLLLIVDSPGGTATASDILYHEIMAYKKRAGAKIVVCMLDIAASGGYYVSLPADLIVAHPTTITGSVGVVFIRPNFTALIDKIGVSVDVNKSGPHKDMGSPFRRTTAEEDVILQRVTDGLADQFLNKVEKHRGLGSKDLATVSTARVFLAAEARDLGLVDRVGYLDEALAEGMRLAGLPEKAKVVVYRRTTFPNDTLYNPLATGSHLPAEPLVNVGIPDPARRLSPGFYYVWTPALSP